MRPRVEPSRAAPSTFPASARSWNGSPAAPPSATSSSGSSRLRRGAGARHVVLDPAAGPRAALRPLRCGPEPSRRVQPRHRRRADRPHRRLLRHRRLSRRAGRRRGHRDPSVLDGLQHLALPHGLRACWSSPIFSTTREVLGTFAMYYREPRAPLPREITWVDAATHLAAIAIGHEAAAQAQRRLLHALGERVKELTLLHRTAALLQADRPLDEALLAELVAPIPRGWQYPEVCEARVACGAIEARTPGWRETPWLQSVSFKAAGLAGTIEVAYLVKNRRPPRDRSWPRSARSCNPSPICSAPTSRASTRRPSSGRPSASSRRHAGQRHRARLQQRARRRRRQRRAGLAGATCRSSRPQAPAPHRAGHEPRRRPRAADPGLQPAAGLQA